MSQVTAVPRLIWFLGLMLAGCVSSNGGGNGGGGGNEGNEEMARCASLSEDWRVAWRRLDNRCATAADCMVIGEPGSCDCSPTVTGDCGVAAARASYAGSEAERLAQEFYESCAFPSICQCAPTQVDCSPEGQCVFTNQFCAAAGDEAGAGHSSGSSGQ